MVEPIYNNRRTVRNSFFDVDSEQFHEKAGELLKAARKAFGNDVNCEVAVYTKPRSHLGLSGASHGGGDLSPEAAQRFEEQAGRVNVALDKLTQDMIGGAAEVRLDIKPGPSSAVENGWVTMSLHPKTEPKELDIYAQGSTPQGEELGHKIIMSLEP